MNSYEIILGAVLLAALLVFIGIWFSYRRQVRKICRQLAFLKTYDSNLKITTDIGLSEIHMLADSINEILTKARNDQLETLKSREILQNTIMSLSHDIRTPLTSLNGYFQLMQITEDENDRKRYEKIIKERIKSLGSMLEELFTYAKLQEAQYVLEKEELDLSKYAYDTLFSFYEDFTKVQMEPKIEIEEHILGYSNQEAWIRILQNLIKNALIHSEGEVSVTLTKQGDTCKLQVTNSVAHPEEIAVEKVFDRFYKAGEDRGKGSTGLGLSIVRGLTEKLGGSVSAGLQENRFCITICLPLGVK